MHGSLHIQVSDATGILWDRYTHEPSPAGGGYTHTYTYTFFRPSLTPRRLNFSNDGLHFYSGNFYLQLSDVNIQRETK